MKKLIYLLGIVFLLGFLGACKKGVPTMPEIDTCPPTKVRIEVELVDEGILWEGQLWSSWFEVELCFDGGKYNRFGTRWLSYYGEPGEVHTTTMYIPDLEGDPLVPCGIHEVKFKLEKVLPSSGPYIHPLAHLYPESIPAPFCQIRVRVIKPTYPYQIKPRECNFGRFQWGPDDVGAEKIFAFEMTR